MAIESDTMPSGRYTAKLAHVKLQLNALGFGRTVVNGVDMSAHTRGVTVISAVGEPTKVVLELLVDTLEIDAEATLLVEEHRLVEKPMEHVWTSETSRGRPVCTVCRIVKGLPSTPEFCTGQPKWASKGPLKTS